jgi:hypothetical protein
VKNRLAMPPLGPMSEAEEFDSLVARIETGKSVRWLTVRDKFAPYGYVPAELRGQPAIRLIDGTPRDTTDAGGALDGITLEGRADLHDDGSATIDLTQSYSGKVGISLRGIFDKVAEAQQSEFVESRLLTRYFPGARLKDLKIENKRELSMPLVVRTRLEAPALAKHQGQGLLLKSLFPMHLAQLAALPARQTPLLIGGSSHVEIRFQIVVPEATRVPPDLPPGEVKDGERLVRVNDVVQGHAIVLNRLVDIPAGRVAPGAEYEKFQHFSQSADELFEREIHLGK